MPPLSETQRQQVMHLYRRAGFGLPLAQVALLDKPWPFHLDKLLADSGPAHPPADLRIVTENELTLVRLAKAAKGDNDEEKKEVVKDILRRGKELNIQWMQQMAASPALLREKMTLFWHGHFACRQLNAFFAQNLNNTLRRLALGKFGDLLVAVSKDAAMLNFLNNKQNRKGHPNENFAREVMELFTLGRGHYSETDIKEAARAFTGWQADQAGEFVFRRFAHDDGSKTFRGRTGKFTGDDILAMILEDRQTARFITEKIYRFFVGETAPADRLADLAAGFYNAQYDIGQLMRRIFSADWFYAEAGRNTLIKSPTELLVGLQRQLGATLPQPDGLLPVQRVLGQVLFFPPNVAGWPGGRSWIDSSTLVARTGLPAVLFAEGQLDLQAKDEGDVALDFLGRQGLGPLRAKADWAGLAAAFARPTPADTLQALATYLLAAPLSATNVRLVLAQADTSSPERLVRSLVLALTSQPEYQLV